MMSNDTIHCVVLLTGFVVVLDGVMRTWCGQLFPIVPALALVAWVLGYYVFVRFVLPPSLRP